MLTVESIQNYLPDLIFVDSSTSVMAIQTLLVANRISTVPILDNRRKRNVGIVRLRALWEWTLTHSVSPSMSDVRERPLPVVSKSESLASALQLFNDNPGVLVQEEDGTIGRYLSPRIVANAFHDYAGRFEPLEVLENHLRKRLSLISEQRIRDAVNRDIAVSEFTFGDYIIAVSKLWDSLGLLGLDRTTVLRMLDSAREFRNQVMHFRMTVDPRQGIDNVEALNRVFSLDQENLNS